jgi:hypothetical protein
MNEIELRFQCIKEAQLFVTTNKELYQPSLKEGGLAKTIVKIADFMMAYSYNTHEELIKGEQK